MSKKNVLFCLIILLVALSLCLIPATSKIGRIIFASIFVLLAIINIFIYVDENRIKSQFKELVEKNEYTLIRKKSEELYKSKLFYRVEIANYFLLYLSLIEDRLDDVLKYGDSIINKDKLCFKNYALFLVYFEKDINKALRIKEDYFDKIKKTLKLSNEYKTAVNELYNAVSNNHFNHSLIKKCENSKYPIVRRIVEKYINEKNLC